jgi:hypothetical protein
VKKQKERKTLFIVAKKCGEKNIIGGNTERNRI